MTKVVFLFAGTGDTADAYRHTKENQATYKDGVVRIYIAGCQESRVGNGFLFPDLEIAATKALVL